MVSLFLHLGKGTEQGKLQEDWFDAELGFLQSFLVRDQPGGKAKQPKMKEKEQS